MWRELRRRRTDVPYLLCVRMSDSLTHKFNEEINISLLFDDRETNVELELMNKGAVQYLH